MSSERTFMTLERIQIKNLFYKFSYNIPLDTKERVSIIHGPNGTGKTTILQLLSSLVNHDWQYLQTTPFDELALFLTEGTLRVGQVRNDRKEDKKEKIPDLKFTWSQRGKTPVVVVLPPMEISLESFLRYPRGKLVREDWKLYDSWRKLRNLLVHKGTLDEEISLSFEGLDPSEILEAKAAVFTLAVSEGKKRALQKASQILDVLKAIPCAMLPATRLFEQEERKTKVEVYADHFKKELDTARGNHGDTSQKLDREFPKKALEWTHEEREQTESGMSVEIASDELEAKYQELVQAGVLGGAEGEEFLLTKEDREIVEEDKTLGYVFAAHYDNLEQKLLVLEPLFEKIDLIRQTVEKFYHQKSIQASLKKGLIAILDKESPLSLKLLSSGEQHILILAYYLVFMAKPNQLVMIDEPELSLHTTWQKLLVPSLRDIGKSIKLNFLLATHSSLIFEGAEESAVELPQPD